MHKDEIRARFIGLDRINHLAACSKSPMLKTVKNDLEDYINDVINLGNPWDLWTDKVNYARRLFAKIINADPGDVAVLYSVSSALNAIMSSFNFKNNNIVTSDLEFPTTNFILQAYKKYGIKIKTIKNDNGIIKSSNYDEYIDENTIMVTAVHVSSLNGFKQDIDEISKMAHEHGSYIYVDDYQSLGSLKIDVKKSKIDFLASGTLKWLLGVSGIAFLYVNPEIVNDLRPANIGWFSQKYPFQFGSESINYAHGAGRFENGTWSIPSVYAAIGGMECILDYNDIEGENKRLFSYTLDELDKNNIKTLTPEQSANIVAIPLKNPQEAESILKRRYNIITSARSNSLRISPHFYNTFEEIEAAVKIIKNEFL
ncbi:aminotransferase class V-fold PLP-dependent enzyme [Picrophilus oshimae]|uniref:Cysteine desulfurase n=1 Tax=Picrophilus torridus (strain ATCC 700027 / DSM 9790 / JCM 10055 / NBRC 100828 / KAW 2/3) TaxID=1122961 RepID=Q6KYU0_PICTO|nr:aminotransferase class V-fold PLP-dependent enzyme [Picrophilus oshimae]AAT44112.1 cysteine desulfurase [Picrophilus oshimae DSM 9789]